jgi:hypothetical protein
MEKYNWRKDNLQALSWSELIHNITAIETTISSISQTNQATTPEPQF